VPNQFEYPDPAAAPMPAPVIAAPATTSDAMQRDLSNAVAVAGATGVVEAQFRDGSAMRFLPGASGVEVQVNRTGSRASHYAERLASLLAEGGAIQCHFADGSSIRIVPFG
jgi:hypothetical protein